MSSFDDVILSVSSLKKHFPIHRGLLRRVVGQVRAVDGVSFDLRRGETLGLVGESGCGKTTAGRCVMRLLDATAGEIRFGAEQVDVARMTERELKPFRRRLQMIFQDPHSSLNPRMTVRDIIAEPLQAQGEAKGNIESRIGDLLEAVGLHPRDGRRYPHAFSGGQRQRIGIARALALNPELIVADEPVSALDVSVQAQILNLLVDLRDQHDLSYIFISHDLSVIRHICNRIAVMYLGRIVEISDAKTLYRRPRHPYTEALISAVPIAHPKQQRQRQRIHLTGDIPNPASPPSGCHFHPRCAYATDECRVNDPELIEIDGVTVACHHAESLVLQGIDKGGAGERESGRNSRGSGGSG